MNLRSWPWWAWVVAVVVLLGVLDVEISLVPMVIAGVVLFKLFGGRGRPGLTRGRPDHGGRPPVDDPLAPAPSDPAGAGHDQPAGPHPPHQPMPTIDVPRYPGSLPPEGPAAPPPAPGAPATDPVVSLGQLHLSRCGSDLRRAVEEGTVTEQARVLDEIHDLVTRMQGMLGAAAGASSGSRDRFEAGLRALDSQVREARGEHPPGAKVTRVVQTCLRMGHTGRYD